MFVEIANRNDFRLERPVNSDARGRSAVELNVSESTVRRGGAKASGLEPFAGAVRHRRWRAVHARRSRPGVSDRREPGSAEKKGEPKRVHRLIVPATRRARSVQRPVFQIPYLCTRLVFAFEEGE
jgi:hypothetical protein